MKPWTCPNCDRAVRTPYCPSCGERPLRPRELTLRGLITHVVQAGANVDGPLLRSFRWLVTRPGGLTLAYLEGRRKPFALPFRLFLIANLLFFAIQSLTGTRVFSTTLAAHLHTQPWSDLATPLVAHRLAVLGTTLDRYAPAFDRAVALNAKSLVVLMVLPFAFLPPLVFYRRRRPFVVHVVFSLHFYAFLLLLFCLSLTVVGVSLLFGGPGLDSASFDDVLSLAEVGASAVYLFLATRPVYGARGAARFLQTGLLTTAAAGIFLGYRFALLLITLYTTS